MAKFAAILSYVGARYCGWQRQPRDEKASVQQTLEESILQMTQEKVSVVASGRTDSGVHAIGQVAHFSLKESKWTEEVLKKGLNSLLPRDIRILFLKSVSKDFHAQRTAEKKQYSYYFQQGPAPLPHLSPYSYWIRKDLDWHAMNEAAKILIGEHDFLPFRAAGATPGQTVRRILVSEVFKEPVSFPAESGLDPAFFLLRFRVVGTGFLKQMVRGISGTLLQIGEGKRPPTDMAKILQEGDRAMVGPTAPARGLWLEQVWYPNGLTDHAKLN